MTGILFNDGFGGNNSVISNLLFNTCRETGDHGPINAWDRMPFLCSNEQNEATFNPMYSNVTNNFIISNYGGSQAFDTDDGTSYYDIGYNFFYAADGLKQDYGGHNMKFHDNLVVTLPYDSQNCLNLGAFNQHGPGNWIWNNKCVLLGCKDYTCVDKLGSFAQCFNNTPIHSWNNQYYSKHGNGSFSCSGFNGLVNISLLYSLGMETNSTTQYLPQNSTIIAWAKTLLNLE